jgi:hypothetical protein
MLKKVAVIIRGRQHEALRMAVGLTLADNKVTVFIMDRPLELDEDNALAIETLGAMGAKIVSTLQNDSFESMTIREVARALTGFDSVIPY